MVDIEHIPAAELRSVLGEAKSSTETMRLVVALNYKHGLAQTELAAMYGLSRKTVYNWLRRLEDQPIKQAVQDADRPGRPPKLVAEERERLREFLLQSPEELGFDETHWTPSLVQRVVCEEFGVKYSLSHTRRLMQPTDSESSQR